MSNKIKSLEKHQEDYKPGTWEDYTVNELQWWVRLLRKRASHRTNLDKKTKDLYDASNYEKMLIAKQKEGN